MILRLWATTVAALLSAGGFVSAQDFPVQIRAILHDPGKAETPFFVGNVGEIMRPLKLVEEGLSEPQKVTIANGSLNLFSTANVDKTNPQAALAATAKVPQGVSSLIVIILPGSQPKPPFSMVVLDDSPKSFPWGESKAVNLTSLEFGLEIGDQKVVVPGGKITAVPKVTKLDEYNRAQTNFYYKQGEEWVVASERQLQYLPTLRRVFLIYKMPDGLAPDVRTILDQPPPVFDKPR